MSENIPDGLRYTKEHEWVRTEGDVVVVGVTDHAQEQLGDVVFLELPDAGTQITAGEPFGVVESVKAVSDLYAPIDGEVTQTNIDLIEAPEGINAEAYGIGWLIKVKPADASSVDALLDAAAYAALLADEAK